jgi:hypothetical protein
MALIPLDRGLVAIAAAVARNGRVDLYLFAGFPILDHMADVDHAGDAAVGPQALEARVVSVEGVVGEYPRGRGAYT